MLFILYAFFSQTFIPGNIYFDSTNYIEFRAGNLPIIISAPHGGDLEPSSFPIEIARAVQAFKMLIQNQFQKVFTTLFLNKRGAFRLSLSICLTGKSLMLTGRLLKLPMEIPRLKWLGTDIKPSSIQLKIVKDKTGLFLELHGHARTIRRIELGYLLTCSELQLSDATIDSSSLVNDGSIRTLVANNVLNLSHSELLSGPASFGTLLANEGFPSFPSTSYPFPQNGEPYFNGSYNIFQHGSQNNIGEIYAIQFELN